MVLAAYSSVKTLSYTYPPASRKRIWQRGGGEGMKHMCSMKQGGKGRENTFLEMAACSRKCEILGKVYAVLSDKEQRALYDEQGIVDEETDTLSQDKNWEEYWRLLFKKITVEDIKAYEEKYKGSEEEKNDIISAYMDFEGNMDGIMESVPCADFEDEPRIRHIIQKAIKSKEIPSYNAFVKESKKKREQRNKRAHEEAKEAEEIKKEMGLGDDSDDLKALIQRRQNDRKKEMDSFFDQLEAKYCNTSKKATSKSKAPKRGKK
uniref:DnaJ heat shock protein family (Hsp40) member C9 n=1 Tax=Xenopus tropicalis TaxID=8364 RepID=A0A803KBR9_XENTR